MLSVIIPAKNEEVGLKKLLPKLKELDVVDEIVVVDDGSTDSTRDVAIAHGAKVYSHPYSKGNGAAVKTGARMAKGEVLVFMDGDGQHDPADIPRLLSRLNEGYNLVVGARQKGSQASFGRGIANKFYNWLASYMTGRKIDDLTSGFRVVDAAKFREFLSLLPNGFSYPTTVTMAFFRAGYSVAYEQIDAAKRSGKSHIQPLRDGIRFLLIIFKVSTLYSPLKIFVPLSAVIFSLGLARYAYTYIHMGVFTNMSALLFLSSVQIFLIGLVSEQITSLLYKEE